MMGGGRCHQEGRERGILWGRQRTMIATRAKEDSGWNSILSPTKDSLSWRWQWPGQSSGTVRTRRMKTKKKVMALVLGYWKWKWKLLSRVQLFATPWTVCSLLGSSVHGILQARTLEWVASPFSRGSSWPRDQTGVSCIAGRFFTSWATREALNYVVYL